jgi:hypothetical protein
MIFGNDESKIVKMAVSCQSEIADGVVQYNYETGELCSASFTTGTVENPANPVIEVFRLPQGEDGKIDYDCDECPHNNYDCRISCCINAYVDNYFDDDFENNFKESVESQIRATLKKYLGEPKGTLATLNEIREMIIDHTEPHKYLDAVQDNWYYDVLDSYVDNAVENGFNITETDAIGYLDGEVEYLIGLTYNADTELMKTVRTLLEKRDIESAFDVLSS